MIDDVVPRGELRERVATVLAYLLPDPPARRGPQGGGA